MAVPPPFARSRLFFFLVPGLALTGLSGGGSTTSDVGSREESCPRCVAGPSFVTPWLEPAGRHAIDAAGYRLQDQDGRGIEFLSMAGKPFVLTFFYSRCDNLNRCARTLASAHLLQKKLSAAGLADDVRIALVTYEPEFDTPEVLRRCGEDYGLRFGDGLRLLRCDPDQVRGLTDLVDAPVNFNGQWVNTHGLSLYLFDRRARLVRQYHSVLWDADDVLGDLRRLSAEPD